MSSRGQGSPDEGSRSDTPEIDYSVIRTAIKIGGKVIDQVLNGIHYGSTEVRNLLLEECDVILECKVCRNMFRGLPNLVAHKRVYCTDTYEEHKRKENEQGAAESEETVVVQPVAPNESTVENGASSSQNKNSKQSVIDKVVNRTFEGQSKSYNFYTKIAEKVEAKKTNKPTSTVTLKAIPSNPNAKIMTVAEKEPSEDATSNQQSTTSDKVSNEKTKEVRNEVDVADTAGNVVGTVARTKPTISQLCDKLASSSAISVSATEAQTSLSKPAYTRPVRSRNRKSSPRKSIDSFIGMKDQEIEQNNKTPSPPAVQKESVPVHNGSIDDDTDFSADMRQFVADYALDRSWLVHCDLKSLTCRTCDKSFTTPYGLKFHCKMKHVDKLVQYPCPQCKKKFTYFTALARHLRAVHTKSESDIEFIQSKLKGKLGRKKSLEDLEADANDAEKSPEQLKKNMLALDTGWKTCDKCGKICWKAKSYYRHYQYCKGSADSSKSSSVDSSPVKNRDKGQIKKVNEKIKAVSNEKEESLKEKHKFNENLTIRTRKQAESMNQNIDQNTKSPFEGMNKSAERIMKSPGITITITEPHEIKDNQKARALSFDKDKQSNNEISPIDIEKVRTDSKVVNKEQNPVQIQTDKTISPKAIAGKADQINVNLVGKKNGSTEKAAVTKKHASENRSLEAAHEKDSVTRALQDALLNFNSSLDKEMGKQKITGQHRGSDKQNTPERTESSTKQSVHEETRTVKKEYVKPVTRKTDGTLKEARRESTDQTGSHQVRSLTISKILMKPVDKQSVNEQRLSKEHIKPADIAINTDIEAAKSPIVSEICLKPAEKQNVNVQSKQHGKLPTREANRAVTSKEVSVSKTVKSPGTSKTVSKELNRESENQQTMDKEYIKPVTRRGDGTLPVHSDKKDVTQNVDGQTSKNLTSSKTVTKSVESRLVSKHMERQKESQQIQCKDYVKPATRGADGTLKETRKQDTHDKVNKSSPAVESPVTLNVNSKSVENQTVNEQNSCDKNILQSCVDKTHNIDKDKRTNETNAKENAEQTDSVVVGELKPISVKIPGSPNVRDTDSVRSSLDSPTWTDNPMLKFKMTVKEMAELVESASLTKFARERKKKAKQILNKKQNGSSKPVKKKIKKKKPVPIVKKVYGTRLSTGAKSETVTISSIESEERGHRYATRNMDVKLAGESEHVGKLDETKHGNEGSNKSEEKSMKVETHANKIKNDEMVIPAGIKASAATTKVEEQATLNSKRKEFLAAKRDQRRKFLLANKTASPKKVSPEKILPTRSRSLKDSPVLVSQGSKTAAIKSLFPDRNEKKTSQNEKTEKSEHNDIETVEGRRLSLRNREQKKQESEKASETNETVATHKIPSEIKKHETVENNEIDTHADVSVPKIRQSRYSTSPEQSSSHEFRSKPSSTERDGRSLVQKPASSERRQLSLPESASVDRPRRLLMQRQIKDDINVKSGRSKSSENIPISKITLSRKTPEKWRLIQSDRELRQPSTRSESNEPSTQIAKTSEMQDKSPKNNKPGINIDKAMVKTVAKETDKENDSASKETENKDTDIHMHKTRLSTGSLPIATRASKIFDTESSATQSSSAEDSAEQLATKSKMKRKRHLSAPQEIVKAESKEVKRFSLSTGVIQCQPCGKKFWKKTSYTVHLMKSPCGKKQKAIKKEMINAAAKTIDMQNESVQEKIRDESAMQLDISVKTDNTVSDKSESNPARTNYNEMNQSVQEKPTDSVELLHEAVKNDDISNKSESGETVRFKSRTKRPLSVSPKLMADSHHSDENTVSIEVSKRPRLETIEKSDTDFNAHLAATENNTVEKGKVMGEEISKDPEIDSVAITEKQDTVREDITPNKMEITRTDIPDEIPGTSKDFSDEDSDTGSEFSGFSEADLSYPKLPDSMSEYDSDCSASKSDIVKNRTGSIADNNKEGNESEMSFKKELDGIEQKNIISIEEIWVDKEAGMPTTEKLKSNRIYVMDTESSRKLHCQDKRNIDSFVDESNLKCLRCEREFSSISNLRQHVIRHLGWKRYQCKMCSVFSCYNLSEARMHLSRSHSVHVDTESDLHKYIKDLNKEAGKKRSTKRMKTIKKKKDIESPTGKRGSSSKAKMKCTKGKSHLVGSNDTDDTNMIADNVDQGNSSQNLSEKSTNNEDKGHKMLKEHEYSKEPVDKTDVDNMNESVEHTVIESNGVLHVEAVNGNASPVKKSVRLAAKEDTRKSAVEILKGPKLSPSPRKSSVSPKSDGKQSTSPPKTNKPVTKSTDSGNKEEESPLTKARQMLANVLKP